VCLRKGKRDRDRETERDRERLREIEREIFHEMATRRIASAGMRT
jgi:hypothetical protein